MNVLFQLFTPLKYLRIRAEGVDKIVVDWILPVALAGITTYAWLRWPSVVRLSGTGSVMDGIGGFMQVLVGFYVAALAAVATFPGSSLEENVNRMTLIKKPLKRRLFLSYLFGYLALLSLILFIGMLFKEVPVALVNLLNDHVILAIKFALHFVYQFVFWQMVVITLLGLHFLIDRINRSDLL